jgi:enolase
VRKVGEVVLPLKVVPQWFKQSSRTPRHRFPRFGGQGITKAASNVTTLLSPALQGHPFSLLIALGARIHEFDSTELKKRIGGNAITAASFALAGAGASFRGLQLFEYLVTTCYGAGKVTRKFKLPTPYFNILNGGKNAGGNLKFQEFMASSSPPLPCSQ